MNSLSNEEMREVAKGIIDFTKKIERINEVLKPYTKRDTPTNNIYRWYEDEGKIGQLLKLKDRLILKRHKLRVKLGIFPF